MNEASIYYCIKFQPHFHLLGYEATKFNNLCDTMFDDLTLKEYNLCDVNSGTHHIMTLIRPSPCQFVLQVTKAAVENQVLVLIEIVTGGTHSLRTSLQKVYSCIHHASHIPSSHPTFLSVQFHSALQSSQLARVAQCFARLPTGRSDTPIEL